MSLYSNDAVFGDEQSSNDSFKSVVDSVGSIDTEFVDRFDLELLGNISLECVEKPPCSSGDPKDLNSVDTNESISEDGKEMNSGDEWDDFIQAPVSLNHVEVDYSSMNNEQLLESIDLLTKDIPPSEEAFQKMQTMLCSFNEIDLGKRIDEDSKSILLKIRSTCREDLQ